MTFTVAIIGRPNVGKSTLFNRLTGTQHALVDDRPGVTRDRREGDASLGPLRFRILDTAGLEEGEPDSLEARMQDQTDRAIEEADVALMLIDGRAGITPHDEYFADKVRRTGKPVILAVNKCEGSAAQLGLTDAWSLGLGTPIPLSAEHGEGLSELYDALEPFAPNEDDALSELEIDEDSDIVQIAIIGRPNAGKSTLTNRLLGEERVLTGPEAGITRDSIAVFWEFEGRPIKLIDTAGIRRRARVDGKLEKMAVGDALRTIRYAQVVVLLTDAEQPLEKQDLTIADHVVTEGRALVVAINKWDLVKNKEEALADINYRLEKSLPQVRGVPVVTLSAKTGQRANEVIRAAFSAYDVWNRRVATAKLNDWLAETTQRHPPPAVRGKRLRLRYMTQSNTRPPTFALFVSQPAKLPDSYKRYLIGALRKDFDLPGVPIRVMLRTSKNPYEDKK